MSAITIGQLFAPSELTTGATVIYTVPALPAGQAPPGITLPNLRVRFANTSGGPVAVTAYAVQKADTPSASNCCANAEAIVANMHMDLDIPVLAEGGTFQAFCDTATAVTVSQLVGVLFVP